MLYINGERVHMGKFPDGTLLIKEEPCEGRKSVTIDWRFENNEELVALIFLANHFRANGVQRIELRMPYIPNARQDRVKNPEDVFTLKYFAGVINSLNFDTVSVLDPHSSVSEALINNLEILDVSKLHNAVESAITRSGEYMNDHGVTELMMFYPDEGAMKRYSGMIKREYAFGIKTREWSTGKITGLDVAGAVDKIAGSTVLIVDDICSRGGTFYYSAKKLHELGAKHILLCVTHCENTILEGEVLTCGLIDKVFTTDSLFTANHDKIEVIKLYEGN